MLISTKRKAREGARFPKHLSLRATFLMDSLRDTDQALMKATMLDPYVPRNNGIYAQLMKKLQK